MAAPETPGYVVGAVTTRLTVTVPHGIVGGELVRVAAPDGSYHSIMVPAGLTAGQQFSVELLAGSNAVDIAKLKMELDAERALRRETQQEAQRCRTVRHRGEGVVEPLLCDFDRHVVESSQALEEVQQKRMADHAFFRDMIKRQRRSIEHLGQQVEA